MSSPFIQWRRTLAACVTLVLALAGSLFALASPASAAVPGLVRVSAVSAFDSVSPKFATATCPAGKVLLGAGYQLNGATGEVLVDDLRPNGSPIAAPTSVVVGAYEEDAFAGSWSVTAFAICANPVVGLVRIAATTTSDSLDFKSIHPSCPTGKALVGTGYELNGAVGEAVVDDFQPTGTTPNALFVGAYEADPDFLGNWSVTAYLICANPLLGLAIVADSSASDSADFHSVSGLCGGKVLTGAGFVLNGVTGEAIVDDFNPNGSATTAPTSIFTGAYEADPDFVGVWTLSAYAICATP